MSSSVDKHDDEAVPEPSSSMSPSASMVRRHVPGHIVGPDKDSTTSSTRAARRTKRKAKGGAGGNATDHGSLIKYGSLLLLILQMVGLVLLMRYTRSGAGGTEQDLYLASTAVFAMETMKFAICAGVIWFQLGSANLLVKEMRHHVLDSPGEILKLSVPSFLYMVQNNLLYLALTNLDAATYQVCYQLKILTTAVFSALLLGRKFSATKWTAIVILTVGVAIVQTSGSGDRHSQLAGGDEESSRQQRLVGLIAVLCAACTSGFSGVYFERVSNVLISTILWRHCRCVIYYHSLFLNPFMCPSFLSSNISQILKGSSTTLWIRNIQMGLPSIILAFATVFCKDHTAVSERGFFHGYTSLVWLVVFVQAAGGLIVAVVVKYADNVLKTFAASFSIIVSCAVSAVLFDFRPNMQFLVGTLLVVCSTAMYSRPDRRKRRRRRQILPTTMKEYSQHKANGSAV